MRKRPAEGEAESPASSPRKGSPKKAKTPPKKAKDEQTLTFGQPCEIKYYRVAEFKLWHARHLDDRTDAFMKNMIDEIRSDPNCELRHEYDFKGDVTRCVSVNDDNPMKNHRKLQLKTELPSRPWPTAADQPPGLCTTFERY